MKSLMRPVFLVLCKMTETDREYTDRMHAAKATTYGNDPCEKCGCLWRHHRRFSGRMICVNGECKCIHLCNEKKPSKKKKKRNNAIIGEHVISGNVSNLYGSISSIINGAVISCANDHPSMLLKRSGSSITKRCARAITITSLKFLLSKKSRIIECEYHGPNMGERTPCCLHHAEEKALI